jgi:hypothetical protein
MPHHARPGSWRPAGPPRHNDGTNANVEAVRSGIEGASTDSKASAVAVHIGGSVRLARVKD